jgi:hypothetical protein
MSSPVVRTLAVALPCASALLLAVSGLRELRLERRVAELARESAALARSGVGARLERRHVPTLDGGRIALGAGTPSTELVFFSPDCPHCETAAPQWSTEPRSELARRRVMVATKVEGAAEFLARHGIASPAVADGDKKLRDTVGSRFVPSRFVVDSRGVVVLDDGMLALLEARAADRHELLPPAVRDRLDLALGTELLGDVRSCVRIDLAGDGRTTLVFENELGLAGFGRVLSRRIARAGTSDLEVFVAFDREGRLAGVLPLGPLVDAGRSVGREELESRARQAGRQPRDEGPLGSALREELAAFERALAVGR